MTHTTNQYLPYLQLPIVYSRSISGQFVLFLGFLGVQKLNASNHHQGAVGEKASIIKSAGVLTPPKKVSWCPNPAVAVRVAVQ